MWLHFRSELGLSKVGLRWDSGDSGVGLRLAEGGSRLDLAWAVASAFGLTLDF